MMMMMMMMMTTTVAITTIIVIVVKAQDRDQQRSLVNTVNELSASIKRRESPE
jgi:hypothetical protein